MLLKILKVFGASGFSKVPKMSQQFLLIMICFSMSAGILADSSLKLLQTLVKKNQRQIQDIEGKAYVKPVNMKKWISKIDVH